jgi:hypothetical protein
MKNPVPLASDFLFLKTFLSQKNNQKSIALTSKHQAKKLFSE